MNYKPVFNNKNPKSKIRNPKLNGLTLTEVLIAMVITAIVASTIYLTFSTVLGGYSKGKAQVTWRKHPGRR